MSGKNKRKKGSAVLWIIFIIAAICFAYSAYHIGKYLYQTYQTNKVRSEIADMVEDETGETGESAGDGDERAAMYAKYGKIYEENHDFIGWLKVDGTAIDNPVMFTPDDGVNGQHYLRKNFYGNYDIGGTLFVDFRCTLNPYSDEGVSTDTIIYGHRMRNETMFGPLRYFKDPDFCKEHTAIQFDTMYRSGRYVLFAAFLSQASDSNPKAFKYYDFINAKTQDDLDDYLKNIKAISLYYDEDNAPKFGDEILTLSTCDYYKTDGRLAIVAKRIN